MCIFFITFVGFLCAHRCSRTLVQRICIMKIALSGYGKMGRMIESVALSRGHEIVCVIDPLTSPQTFDSPAFRSADVAIEFTRPEAAEQNVRAALAQGVPVVSGTTGWDVEGLKATLNAPYGEADRSTVGRKEHSTLHSPLRGEPEGCLWRGREWAFHLTTRNLCVQKHRYHNSDNGKSRTPWPADEIDENAVRYIDLAVTAPADSALRITGISMDLSAVGTAAMSCHINTGFGDNFTDVHTYYEKVGLKQNTLTPVAIAPTHLTVPAGKTLHIRILPWLNDESAPRSGKYIGVSKVRIEGVKE